MKTLVAFLLLTTIVWAQGHASNEGQRLRISNKRVELNAAFAVEEAACYKKFLVNNCLNEVNGRRRDALADLRRQEVVLNEQDRKLKAAEQLKKTDKKLSPEKQQQAADARAQALKDFDARMARELEETKTRAMASSDSVAREEAAKNRAAGVQEKQTKRSAKQSVAAQELENYNQRIAKAQERTARFTREKASQTKPSAQPLPVPE